MDPTKNFAYSTVATAPSPATSGTSLSFAAGEGARMPATPFNLVVWPTGAIPTSTNSEVTRVTALAGDVATIVRQREGSSARTIVIGDQVAAATTVKSLDEPSVRDAPLEDEFVPAGKTLLVGRGLKIDNNLTVDGEVVTL